MPKWAGDNISRNGMHKRVRRARGDACKYNCVGCGQQADDWAQIHDTNFLDINSYRPMCTKCHLQYDLGGIKRSREFCAKISAAKTGVPNPAARKMMTGRKLSPETRARMSAAQSKRWERWRQQNGNASRD